jgi:hypothetical protein
VAGSTMEVITVDVSMEIARVQINPNQDGGIKKEVLCTEKASGEGGAGNPYTCIAETGNSEEYLSTKKNTTWVLDSAARDHLVKEDTHVVNKYELPIPTKIHIAKSDNYLLAYAKGDIIARVLCTWRSKEH